MVTHFVLSTDIEAQLRVADEVARGLAHASVQGSDILIRTPVSFPSGRMIGVKLLGGPTTYTITDDGSTMREAELMGAVDICRREARKVADEYDLRFNEWELFEVDAQVDRLVGATLIVTNAAALVMIRTADRFAERFDLRRRESLAVRLERIFGEKRVRKDVEVMGAAKKWFTADDKAFLKRAARRVFEASDADDDFRMAA